MDTRRDFLKKLATATGALVIVPVAVGCGGEGEVVEHGADRTTGGSAPATDPLAVPTSKPAVWDPIAFNRDRGNAGAIPESYREAINGPDGEGKHLGKHLPYLPGAEAPAGMLAVMWGDPSKGHARHPNAPPSDDNPDGHWYDWIRVRRATDEDAEELESRFGGWPEVGEGNGRYGVDGGGDIAENGGENTIYIVALPSDVGPGDTIRIHAHCLTHGEYVDFVTLPA